MTEIATKPVGIVSGVTIDNGYSPDRGPLVCDYDVNIIGNVQDGVSIKTGADLSVSGAIEAAKIQATHIKVTGGILGKSAGQIVALKSFSAKFGAFADIRAGAAVQFETEIAQSTILTRGSLLIPNGTIAGGRIVANGGIECRILGNPTGLSTEIGVGFDAVFDESAARDLSNLETILKQAADVRNKVEPLMKQQKLLSAAQKEKAIELLYEASESESRAKDSARTIRASIEEIDALARPELVVRETLYANVIIRFRGAYAITRSEVRGPIKVTLQKSHQMTAVCVTELDSGKSCFLETVKTVDPTLAIRATLSQIMRVS